MHLDEPYSLAVIDERFLLLRCRACDKVCATPLEHPARMRLLGIVWHAHLACCRPRPQSITVAAHARSLSG